MILLQFLISSLLMLNNVILFDFNKDSDLSNWAIVDDVVMGGRSDGHFEINQEGNGVFHGAVSLENNGGFSSVRYRCDQVKMTDYSKVVIRLKGDGKSYQFRIKSDKYDRHSYVYYFETKADWQTIEIPLDQMIPSFRGRKLAMENYPGEALEEIAILISNKKAESFQLEIDAISLK